MTGDHAPLVVPALDGLRLGIAREYYFAGLDPAVARVVEDVLQRLADVGVVIIAAEIPGLSELIELITLPVQAHDVVPSLTNWLKQSGADLTFDELLAGVSTDVRAVLELIALPDAPHAVSEDAYLAARDVHLPALRSSMALWFAEHRIDAMLLPATMVAAVPIGAGGTVRIGEVDVAFPTAVGRNIAPGSTAGLPGLVLPAGLADGLPVAIELDGPSGTDRKLLGIGLAIEAIVGALMPHQ